MATKRGTAKAEQAANAFAGRGNRVHTSDKRRTSRGHRSLPRCVAGLIVIMTALTLPGVGAATVPGIVYAAGTPGERSRPSPRATMPHPRQIP